MRILLLWALSAIPVLAQTQVQLTNMSRPGSSDFKVGDYFQIMITGMPNQPVSVRTTLNGRTDWSSVIGQTQASGLWWTTRQLEEGDFGNWSEVWTVGGKLAAPTVDFFVGGACLANAGSMLYMGRLMGETCETAEGRRTFMTPSDTEPFRTPDGRTVPGRTPSNRTAEQYRTEIIESLITGGDRSFAYARSFGDEAAVLITKLIGVNALTGQEMRNVLSTVRSAFERPQFLPETAKNPVATLLLLRNMGDAAEEESLKEEIAGVISYVQASYVQAQ